MSVRKHDEIVHAGRMINCRTGAMYPNIAINLDVLGPATGKYQDLLTERTKVKHKDKARSDALKLILNSVYGNLGNQYSTLHNPKAQVGVCVYGQISLYELGKRLSQYAEIVQMNTDGVAFVPHDAHYKGVQKQWEEDFGLRLEEDRFDRWIQKDVNNYIAVTEDGDIYTKGGEVGRYNRPFYFRNNSTRIVDICIVDYLLYGKDVVTSLMEHVDKPELYQHILQAGRTFKGTFDQDGNQYNNVNRVFAVKRDGVLLQKKRQDDGLVRFADAPTQMLVWNDDVDKLENFEEIVDLNFYYQMIKRKLEGWR